MSDRARQLGAGVVLLVLLGGASAGAGEGQGAVERLGLDSGASVELPAMEAAGLEADLVQLLGDTVGEFAAGEATGGRRALAEAAMLRGADDAVWVEWVGGLDTTRAVLLRTERVLLRGDGEEALAVLRELDGRALTPADVQWGAFLRAEALRLAGRPMEARAFYEEVAAAGDLAHLRGRALVALGERDAARLAFSAALESGEDRLRAGAGWAEVLVAEGLHGEASALLREMMRDAPWHAPVWLISGRLALEADGDGARARLAARAARALGERAGEATLLEAEVALREGDLESAETLVEEALREGVAVWRGEAVRALVLAVRGRDAEGLEAAERAMSGHLAPVQVPLEVGRAMERRYRYPSALQWFERAVAADGEDSEALVALGLAQSRAGHDAAAVELFRRSVAVGGELASRLLSFHEEVLGPFYVDVRDPVREGLVYRLHRDEAHVLLAYLPEVVHGVLERYEERYGTRLERLRVEVFREAESFGLRAFGRPDITPHGYCFGPVVAIRSPSSGDFNWQHVLEHEISHVFTLQVSDWRVPRWFTEGVAEWDVVEAWPDWRRRADLQVARALRSGALPRVWLLDEAFIRRWSTSVAYHQSFLLVEWIADAWGSESLVAMTRAYGDLEGDGDRVFEEVLGVSMQEADRRFREDLHERLRPLVRLYEPDPLQYVGSGGRRTGEPGEPALEQYFRGRITAEWAARDALRRRPEDPAARWVLARAAVGRGDLASWQEHVEVMERRGRRSATLWWTAAQVAQSSGELEVARERYLETVGLAPELSEAWEQLGRIEAELGDEEAAGVALGEAVRLDAGLWSGRAWLFRRYVEQGKLEEALSVGREMVRIRPFMDGPWRLAIADVAEEVGDLGVAWRELHLELVRGSADVDEVRRRLSVIAARCGACVVPFYGVEEGVRLR